MKLMWRAWCDVLARRGLRSNYGQISCPSYLADQLPKICLIIIICSGQDPVQRAELSKSQCVYFEDWGTQHLDPWDLLRRLEPGLCCRYFHFKQIDSTQVDLAGSERIKESGSEGVRLTEAQVQFRKQSNWVDFAYFLSRRSTRAFQISARSSWRCLRR